MLKASNKGAAKGVSVVSIPSNRLPLLHADPHAVQQMIDNLLSNAVKFTSRDGRVVVSVQLSARNELEIRVSDTGIGIATERQAHVFEPFGRDRPEVTASGRGTGLGLPIVKGLVDMHGGRIRLESALGEGTSVSVIFPASRTVEPSRVRVA